MVTWSLDAVGGVERDYLGNIPSSKYNSVLNSIKIVCVFLEILLINEIIIIIHLIPQRQASILI